jgi:hypothetical protein
MLEHENPWRKMEGAIESAVLTCRENPEALNCLACMGANILGFLGREDKGFQKEISQFGRPSA